MNTEIKLAMLAILSLTLLTAITVASGTSLVTPVFEKIKHCEKSDSGCDIRTAKNDKNLSNANNPSTQSDQSQNDSNIIDEEGNLEEAQSETDNSTSSIDSQAADPFSLVGM